VLVEGGRVFAAKPNEHSRLPGVLGAKTRERAMAGNYLDSWTVHFEDGTEHVILAWTIKVRVDAA
jgi:hypothetical protein